MTRFWAVNMMSAVGRLVALAGAALAVGAVVAYVSGWVVSALRYAPDWNVGILPLVFVLQIVVAGCVVWSALTAVPRRLLRNVLVAFALTFLLGYGTIEITLLDEDGYTPFGTDGPFPTGDSVGGGKSADGGTFRLEIAANDGAKYAVVVCDGAGPGGWNRDDPDQG